MKIIRRLARTASGAIGRDSSIVNALRPAYDNLLEWSSGGKGIVQTVNGQEQFRVDPRYRVHFPESYDPVVCSYLRENVRAGDICLNIGAHVGIYALCLSRWSAPDGRVFAFEPNPATRKVLEKHVALNHAEDRIKIFAAAVGSAPGEAEFFATGLEGYSRLGMPNPDVTHSDLNPITVPIVTIDEFCSEHGIAPNWITLDIEGYEIAALRGARETIRAARGRLKWVVEMHSNLWPDGDASRAELEDLMKELSLRLVPLTGQRDPISDYGIVLLEGVKETGN